MRQKNSIYCWRNPGEGLEEGGVAVVGPAAVEEEAEAVDGKQVCNRGALPVRPAQRRHLQRRPHPFTGGGGGDWNRTTVRACPFEILRLKPSSREAAAHPPRPLEVDGGVSETETGLGCAWQFGPYGCNSV